MDHTEAELKKAFDSYDADGDGQITVDEMREALRKLDPEISEDEVQEAVAEADVDGDGKVSFAEFARMSVF